jgi:hypothetical protein
MDASTEIITGAITATGCCGLLFFILRNMNGRINGKLDKEAHIETHKAVEADLARGEEKFNKIIETQDITNTTLNTLNTSVILLTEKVERLERHDSS